MDPDSPFAHMPVTEKTRTGTIYVNFCQACHYVWKAPAMTTICINCKGNGEPVVTLASYEASIPIT